MKHRGFTLIEVLVGLVFVSVIFLIALPIMMGVPISNGSVSFGVNGMTESRCIDGYKFIVDQNGSARQILDEFGKGAKCFNNPDPGKIGSFGSNR